MSFILSTRESRPVFIVNRNAGRFQGDPGLLDRLVRIVDRRGDILATSTGAELDEAARLAARGTGPVVLCGGDGTYLASLTALERATNGAPLPPIVLVRGGTVSIAAKNWAARASLEHVVRDVVERPETLRFVMRPTLAVASQTSRHVGFTFGTGLVASFFVEYERAGARGNGVALAIAARTFASSLTGGAYAAKILAPLPCRISVDGELLPPRAFSLVVASVLRDVGLHFLVTYRAGEDPARPHLVASSLAPRALAPQWLRVVRGRPLRGDGNFDGLARSFTVDFGDDAGPYILDGDGFRAKSVTVTAGPVIRVAA